MMKNLIVILITVAIIILPVPLFGDTQAPNIPTAPMITKVDDTYVIPVNIAPCPVCHLKSWIIIEDAPITKIVQVRCTNPQHQYLLVISGGDTYQEAVENWNTR